MTQITLKVEDALVNQLGKDQIERLIEGWLHQYQRRLALHEATEELSTVNLSNDPQWQAARSLAWETYQQNFEHLTQ